MRKKLTVEKVLETLTSIEPDDSGNEIESDLNEDDDDNFDISESDSDEEVVLNFEHIDEAIDSTIRKAMKNREAEQTPAQINNTIIWKPLDIGGETCKIISNQTC